jgi:hypothetical protein
VKHQAVFKRLSIRPMVNLAAGKNSTDIALAVDAIDLVLAERPDVVVIASSDSDFAPLVSRLREKGCRVEGIGQQGKTGEETRQAYDDFTVLAHGEAAKKSSPTARKTAVRATPAARSARGRSAAAPAAVPASGPAAERAVSSAPTSAAPAPEPAPAPRATTAPAAPTLPRAARSGSRGGARKQAGAASAAPVAPVASPPTARGETVDKLAGIREHLPELARGGALELRVVSERLRKAGLLGPKASVTRLLAAHGDVLELEPAGQPNRVRLRSAPGASGKR